MNHDVIVSVNLISWKGLSFARRRGHDCTGEVVWETRDQVLFQQGILHSCTLSKSCRAAAYAFHESHGKTVGPPVEEGLEGDGDALRSSSSLQIVSARMTSVTDVGHLRPRPYSVVVDKVIVMIDAPGSLRNTAGLSSCDVTSDAGAESIWMDL